MDFYAILEVDSRADTEAIRAAYRSLARRYHPDAGNGSSSEKFRQITEAYETLSDPQRRAAYDQSREPRRVANHGSPFAEWDLLFEQWKQRRS